MKLLHQFLLLLALLAAVALAARPEASEPVRTLNLTINDTYPVIGPNNLVLDYNDLMSGPEPEDRFANISAPGTVLTALNTDPTEGSHGLIIRMGTSKQHVGELKGQRVWDMIHGALKKACPLERCQIGCYPDMPGAFDPNKDGTPNKELVFYKNVLLTGIPYKDDEGMYATNAYLNLTLHGMFRDQRFSGLGAATYEMIAGVFKAATEHKGNCCQEHFEYLSRPYELCNVPDHVMVARPVHKGQVIQSWVSLRLEFNGETKFGDLNCYNTMTPVIKFWEGNVLPDVAKIMGTAVDDWKEACTECFKEKEAFEVKTWRNFRSEGCSYLNYVPN
ncbi:hypothetical protein E8E12_011338 [Didymella heteroderae]|uniref:Uncharacterized protein n=1 Tax=Didymella heteroderae TaxID=1769908 RepID=A0A9P4X0L6_9PLEO|nr:hypothetical protein E8E12_011338 [Didymella heteroderae]